MYNFAPEGYKCPLCLTANGIENEDTMAVKADVVYQDDLVFAMVNSKFVGNNPGHVIIVPNDHYENIFDLPNHIGHRIFELAKQVAIAMKAVRKCDGVMTFQNNGPASGQHAFHFHFHVLPRFADDKYNENRSNARVATPEERLPYANDLKQYFIENPIKLD